MDSEHSAIFQCLAGRGPGRAAAILLTGSGGPFRGWTPGRPEDVTPEQAVAHPNWSMGAKITVDSATMMNKGLEFIEAMHLFAVCPGADPVLIHPQSAVHSMVELLDGTVIAQLGVADMGLPIQYALTWPERCPRTSAPGLCAPGDHALLEPDLEKLPCLRLAMDCARRGPGPCVLSAANEVAVAAFPGVRAGLQRYLRLVAAAVDAGRYAPARAGGHPGGRRAGQGLCKEV